MLGLGIKPVSNYAFFPWKKCIIFKKHIFPLDDNLIIDILVAFVSIVPKPMKQGSLILEQYNNAKVCLLKRKRGVTAHPISFQGHGRKPDGKDIWMLAMLRLLIPVDYAHHSLSEQRVDRKCIFLVHNLKRALFLLFFVMRPLYKLDRATLAYLRRCYIV